MNCMPWIRFRMMFALGGMVMPSASSTARQLATAWTTVQTPQIRWVNAHASRGPRPSMTISMPRNWGEWPHALVIRPPSAWASIRRCPSMRVMGSTTTLVAAMGLLLPAGGRRRRAGVPGQDGQLPPLPRLVDAGGDGVRGDARRRTERERSAEDVHGALHAEAAHVGEPVVERRHRVPEVPLGAADAGVPRPDRPAGPPVPHEDRAGREGGRSLAPDVIEAPALARVLVVEDLHG